MVLLIFLLALWTASVQAQTIVYVKDNGLSMKVQNNGDFRKRFLERIAKDNQRPKFSILNSRFSYGLDLGHYTNHLGMSRNPLNTGLSFHSRLEIIAGTYEKTDKVNYPRERIAEFGFNGQISVLHLMMPQFQPGLFIESNVMAKKPKGKKPPYYIYFRGDVFRQFEFENTSNSPFYRAEAGLKFRSEKQPELRRMIGVFYQANVSKDLPLRYIALTYRRDLSQSYY